MQTHQPSIFARHDTLLGICQAVGEDFGFNPTYLRALFAGVLFFNLAGAIAAYLALGAIVLLSRLIYRRPRRRSADQAAPLIHLAEAPVAALPGLAQQGACSEALPLAAAA